MAMTCTEWFDLVSAAADGQLHDEEQARLDAHLAACPSCRALLDAFERERRRRRLAPPADHGALVARVLAEREQAPGRAPRHELVRRGVLAIAVVVALAVGFGSASRTTAERSVSTTELASSSGVLIDAEGQTFDDAQVEVAAGTTVEWRNTGTSTHHLVRSLGGAVVAEDLAPGHSEGATFAEPGTYEFWCTIHRGMVGTVQVDA